MQFITVSLDVCPLNYAWGLWHADRSQPAYFTPAHLVVVLGDDVIEGLGDTQELKKRESKP